MELNSIIPLGRTHQEYVDMFNLTPSDLDKSIIDVGGGPAGFVAGQHARGARAVAVDPIFAYELREIQAAFERNIDVALDQINEREHSMAYFGSLPNLRLCRKQAFAAFAHHFCPEWYQQGALPRLDFADSSFDLALCSHLLFLYTDHFHWDDHLASIWEMLRIAAEVRIFPIYALNGELSRYYQPTLDALHERGYQSETVTAKYVLWHNSDQMLRIWR